MRAAFLIGQANYDKSSGFAKLEHTHNDVAGVDEVLRTKCGFQVTRVMDASRADFECLPRLFAQSLRGFSDGIFLLYYAGHGRCINGQHFLVPVDATNTEPSSFVNLYALIQKVHDVSEGACAGTRRDAAAESSSQGAPRSSLLIVLDSCRERAEAQCKLASMTHARRPRPITTDVSILFACDEGKGAGENEELKHGLLTAAFIRVLACPGLTWHEVCDKARAECLKDSKNQQNPWMCHRSSRSSDLVLHNMEVRPCQIDAVIHDVEERSCQTDVVIRSAEDRSCQTAVVASCVTEASCQADLPRWWAWRHQMWCWMKMRTSQFNGCALRNPSSCLSDVGSGFLRLLMTCSMGYFVVRYDFVMDMLQSNYLVCSLVCSCLFCKIGLLCVERMQRIGGDAHAEDWKYKRIECFCLQYVVLNVHYSFLVRTISGAEVTGVDCALTKLLVFSSIGVRWLDFPASLPPPREQAGTLAETSFQYPDRHCVARDISAQPYANWLALWLMHGVGAFVLVEGSLVVCGDWGVLWPAASELLTAWALVIFCDGIFKALFCSCLERFWSRETSRSELRGWRFVDVLASSVYASDAMTCTSLALGSLGISMGMQFYAYAVNTCIMGLSHFPMLARKLPRPPSFLKRTWYRCHQLTSRSSALHRLSVAVADHQSWETVSHAA